MHVLRHHARAAEPERRQPRPAAKEPREMGLVAKAQLERDLRDRLLAAGEQLARTLDAAIRARWSRGLSPDTLLMGELPPPPFVGQARWAAFLR